MRKKNEYNFKEKEKYFESFNIEKNCSDKDMYEYCEYMYHKEARSNLRFKNMLILTIPFAVFQIIIGATNDNNTAKLWFMGLGIFLLFQTGYFMGKCSEWERRNELFLHNIKNIIEK